MGFSMCLQEMGGGGVRMCWAGWHWRPKFGWTWNSVWRRGGGVEWERRLEEAGYGLGMAGHFPSSALLSHTWGCRTVLWFCGLYWRLCRTPGSGEWVLVLSPHVCCWQGASGGLLLLPGFSSPGMLRVASCWIPICSGSPLHPPEVGGEAWGRSNGGLISRGGAVPQASGDSFPWNQTNEKVKMGNFLWKQK